MNRSSTSSGTTVLLLLIFIFTLPLWIGLAGGMIALFVGLLGGFFGLIGGIIGIVVSVIGGIFKAIFHGIFGWGSMGDWPHFHMNPYTWFAIVIIAALIINKRKGKA